MAVFLCVFSLATVQPATVEAHSWLEEKKGEELIDRAFDEIAQYPGAQVGEDPVSARERTPADDFVTSERATRVAIRTQPSQPPAAAVDHESKELPEAIAWAIEETAQPLDRPRSSGPEMDKYVHQQRILRAVSRCERLGSDAGCAELVKMHQGTVAADTASSRRAEPKPTGAVPVATDDGSGSAITVGEKQTVGKTLEIAGMTLGPIPEDHPRYGKLEGVHVSNVEPGSDAEQAGFRQGYIIVEVHALDRFQPVRQIPDLEKAIQRSTDEGRPHLLVSLVRSDGATTRFQRPIKFRSDSPARSARHSSTPDGQSDPLPAQASAQPPARAKVATPYTPITAIDLDILSPEGLAIGIPLSEAKAKLNALGYEVIEPGGKYKACVFIKNKDSFLAKTQIDLSTEAIYQRDCVEEQTVKHVSVQYSRELESEVSLLDFLGKAEAKLGSRADCQRQGVKELYGCNWSSPPNAPLLESVRIHGGINRFPREKSGGRVKLTLQLAAKTDAAATPNH